MEYMESRMQDRIEGSNKEYEHYLELQDAVKELLTHREGRLPTRGWLRDNDKSRAALGKLAELVGEGA